MVHYIYRQDICQQMEDLQMTAAPCLTIMQTITHGNAGTVQTMEQNRFSVSLAHRSDAETIILSGYHRMLTHIIYLN